MFQEALSSVAAAIEDLGMELNTAKTQLLDISLRHFQFAPLELNGILIPPLQTIRFLGVTLDSRINFTAHWTRVAASAKGVLGAVSRLCHRDPWALKALYMERVQSMLLFSLPYAAPHSQSAWSRLNGVASHYAHLLTNIWVKEGRHIHGDEIREMAGGESISDLYLRHSLRMVQRSLAEQSAYRFSLDDSAAPPRRPGLRSSSSIDRAESFPRLKVPPCHQEALSRLQPRRAAILWNAIQPTLAEIRQGPTALSQRLSQPEKHFLCGFPSP